ncbi:hypothetical protein KKH27_12460 [bacterium]|nr:hypothetical protein [bacterium]MBU1982811.1 hypothetical protein [bacterium]
MKITLNGLDLARHAEGDRTVGDVLAELVEEIRRGGKVVTQVMIDGRVLTSDWQRGRLLASSVGNVQRLDLQIDDPAHLRQQTIQDAGRLVEKLVNQCKPLGRKFRIGDEVTANNDLADYLEDLKWVVAGLDYSTRGGGNANALSSARTRLMESANRLLQTLDRIYKAQAAGDYIAIADEIEYDLFDQLTGWVPLLGQAKREVQALSMEK